MPLHMTDDPDQGNDYVDNGRSSNGGGGFGGGGGSNLLNFLPLLLGLFGGGRNRGGGGGGGRGGCGGGGLVLVIIAVAAYFLFFRGGCNLFNSGDQQQQQQQTQPGQFSESGYDFNPQETAKAQVYEGLEDDNTKNPLPEAVSLLAFAPDRQNQGKQGSCVAWSSAYAARTILEAAASREDPNAVAYSPAFLYNNIALEDCQGSYIQKAMEFMQSRGAVSYRDFQYDENDCSRQASGNLLQNATQNKIHGFHRLTESDDVNGINIRAIKEHLAKDAPVVIGMMVGGTFMQEMMGQRIWHPSGRDAQQMGFGGHAMCVIGYDDRIEGGAFQLMNSWGPQWGDNGVAFVRYADFKEYVREAYGLDPLAKKGAALNVPLECNIGLQNYGSKQYISLRPVAENVYRTAAPVRAGTRFKMEINNEVECYIYIFTPDESGKSFVLFPYKPIHSSYCGITGYRVFPRKESIEADAIGNRDFMAVVVSRQALDYAALNERINSSSGSTYADKVNAALAANRAAGINFSAGEHGGIHFRGTASADQIVSCIVEIDKQ